jgi:hypothetical protein
MPQWTWQGTSHGLNGLNPPFLQVNSDRHSSTDFFTGLDFTCPIDLLAACYNQIGFLLSTFAERLNENLLNWLFQSGCSNFWSRNLALAG